MGLFRCHLKAVRPKTAFSRLERDGRDDGDDVLEGTIVTPETVTPSFPGGVTVFRAAPRSQKDRHDRHHRHAPEKHSRFTPCPATASAGFAVRRGFCRIRTRHGTSQTARLHRCLAAWLECRSLSLTYRWRLIPSEPLLFKSGSED